MPTGLRRRTAPPLSPPLRGVKRPKVEEAALDDVELHRLEPSVEARPKEWKIIERATGISFSSPSESLSSLDSLRQTKMVSALRRETGKRLTREQVKQSTTLGELLGELAQTPEEENLSIRCAVDTRQGRKKYKAWGMMWNSRCSWLLHRSRPLPEPVLRTALKKMVDRHAALRVSLIGSMAMFVYTQQIFTVFELWRRHGHRYISDSLTLSAGPLWLLRRLLGGVLRRVGRLVERPATWSFMSWWPEVCAKETTVDDSEINLKVLPCLPTIQEAEAGAWNASRTFKPPFQAVLAPYGEPVQGALLLLGVSHMVSDGYSVIAILNDLAQLVTQEEQLASLAAGGPPVEDVLRPLPEVPDMLRTMELRVMHTINGGTDDVHSGDVPVHSITRDPIGSKPWRDAMGVRLEIPQDVILIVREIARLIVVPEDTVVLSVLGTTFARLNRNPLETIAMIVPQRDGPAENDMVGLFADIRHFNVNTEGLSHLGVALRLHHIVQRRMWYEPGLQTQWETTLVNFEWTDTEERHGFSQRISLLERDVQFTLHPLKVALDQADKETWRMQVDMCPKRYTEADRDSFETLFKHSLWALRYNPLALVWPEGTAQERQGQDRQ